MNGEIWKAINEHYEVSNHGRVRSVDREIADETGRVRKYKGKVLHLILNPHAKSKNVCLRVGLEAGKQTRVDALVWEAFIGGDAPDYIFHKDVDPKNNRPENLFEKVSAK